MIALDFVEVLDNLSALDEEIVVELSAVTSGVVYNFVLEFLVVCLIGVLVISSECCVV